MIQAGDSVVSAADADSEAAAEQLVADALDDIDGADAEFGILFCSTAFDLEPFIDMVHDELSSHDIDWVGCSTAGEITAQGPKKHSAVLLLVGGDGIAATVGVAPEAYDDPVAAGKAAAGDAAQQFADDERDDILFTVLPGQTFTQESVTFDVLNGIVRAVPDVPVVGGAAGDDYQLHTTYQFYNGEIYTDAVVLAGISSTYPIHTGKGHGLRQKVASGVVNETDGTVLKTISGQPAAEFYADAIDTSVWRLRLPMLPPRYVTLKTSLRYIYLYLTRQTDLKLQRVFRESLEHTIAVEMGSDDYRVVSPLWVNWDNGLVLQTPVPENQAIHIVNGNRDDVVNAGTSAFSHIDTPEEDPVFGVFSDCMVRNIMLSDDEQATAVEALHDTLNCPLIGFYSYGEIGGSDTHLCTAQNQTVSGFVITEPVDD